MLNKDEGNGRISNLVINIIIIFVTIGVATFVLYGFKNGLFRSQEAFLDYIEGFGIWAALVFIIIQIIMVVVTFLPSTLGCVVGVIIFGPWIGFTFNYLGICIASIINFSISRRYGSAIVKKMMNKKYYDKYIGWAQKNSSKFDKIFTLAVLIPGAPADFLSYIAGLTKMKLTKMILIVFICKPFPVAVYIFGTQLLLNKLFGGWGI